MSNSVVDTNNITVEVEEITVLSVNSTMANLSILTKTIDMYEGYTVLTTESKD